MLTDARRSSAFSILAAFLSLGSFAPAGTQAATIDQRLQAVESKTNYFVVKRFTKTKVLRHTNFRDVVGDHFYVVDFPITGTDPVVSNIWLQVTGTYSADAAFHTNVVLGPASHLFSQQQIDSYICQFPIDYSADSSVLDKKFFCQGAVNVQNGQVLRAGIFFYPAEGHHVTVNNLAITAHVVNQVITEPPQ